MKGNFKNLLMAGTALAVALGCAPSVAVAATEVVNGSDVVISADPEDSPAIQFLSDHTATVDSDVDITDTVTTSVNNQGTLTFSGSSTMTGVVGAVGAELKLVNAGAGSVTFTNNVHATDINVTGSNTLDFGGHVNSDISLNTFDATIEMANGANINGTITSTAGGSNGTLTLEGSTNISGAVSDAANSLKAINVSNTGTSILSGAVYADDLNVTGTGTTTLNSTFTGVDININSTGSLVLNGVTTLAGDVSFLGVVGDGTVTIGSGLDFASDINNVGAINNGTVIFAGGAQTVSGNIGSTSSLKAVNAAANGAATVFNGTVNAGTINVTGTGTATFNNSVTGDVDYNDNDGVVILSNNIDLDGDVDNTGIANNTGTLTLVGGGQTISGAVGSTQALKVINAGANASVSSFLSTVDAETINVTGTGEISFGGNVTGAVAFGADGLVTLEDGASLTGSIDTGVGNTGTLTLAGGTQAVSGNVGAVNALKVVNAGSTGGSAIFSGTIDAADINVTGTGSVIFNGDVTSDIDFNVAGGTVTFGDTADLTGAITTSNNGTGALVLTGSSTISGDVGASLFALSSITAGATGSTSTFSSNIYATDVNISGDGTVIFANDITATRITFNGAGNATFNNAATITLSEGVDLNGQDANIVLQADADFTNAINNNGTANKGILTLAGGTQDLSEDIGSANGLAVINAGVNGSTSNFAKTVNAENINLSGTGTVNFSDDVTGIINFNGGSATLNFANDADLTGSMTTANNNTGIIVFAGSSAVSGDIGGALKAVASIGVGAAVSTSTFSGNIFATTTNITGTGTVNFGGDVTGTTLSFADAGIVNFTNASATVTLSSGVDFNDQDGVINLLDAINFASDIDNAAGAGGKGTLNLAGGAQTVTGNVGATNSIGTINAAADDASSVFSGTVDATQINLTGTGDLALDGDVTSTINFNVDGGTLTFGDGADLTGTITTSTHNTGAVVLAGSSTVSGDIGTSLKAVNSLTAGATASISTFSSDIYASNISISSTGTVNFANDVIATGLTYAGGGTVNLTNNLATITIANGVDFYSQDGTLVLASGLDFSSEIDNKGTITTRGTLTLAGGAQTISEIVGGTNSIGTINAAANAAVSTFSKAVNAGTVNLTGTGTLNFSDDVTGNIDYNVAGGIVNLSNGSDVTGNVSATVDNNGTLNLVGSSTITGNVGASGRDLLVLNAGAASSASIISGDVYANNINVTSTGSLSIGGNVEGAIDGTGGGLGSGVGDVILTGSSTGITSIGATGVLNSLLLSGSNNTVTIANNVRADTINVELNTLTINNGGGYTVAAGQTLEFDIGNTDGGLIIATNGLAIDADANIILTVSPIEYVEDGATYTVVNDLTDGGGVATINNLSANDTPMVSYIQDTTNTDDLVIIVSRKSLDTFVTTPNATTIAGVMDNMSMNGDGDLDQVQLALQAAGNAGDNAAVSSILNSLTTTSAGSLVSSNLSLGSLTQGVHDGRLASLRLGDASYYADGETGINAGVMVEGFGMWAQGYGSSGKQDAYSDYNGYNLSTHGFVIGADSNEIFEDTVVGLSVAFGQSRSNSRDTNQTAIDIDNYGFTIYSNYDFNNNIFLDTQIGYGYNEIESKRLAVGDPADPKIASARYSSTQYLAKATFGADIWTNSGMIVTPIMSIAPTYLNVGSYEETGAGGLGLNVESTDLFVLDTGIGINLSTKLRSMEDSSMLKPMFHAKYTYDFMGEEYASTSSFLGDSAKDLFSTADAPMSQDRINTGVGVAYSSDLYALSLKYDYELRDHYNAHSGAIRLVSGF